MNNEIKKEGKLAQLNSFLRKILEVLCALIISLMTLTVLWGVVTRYVFGEQAAFTDELARLFLIWLSFFGGSLAFARKAHVGVEALTEFFSIDAKILTKIIATFISFIFAISVLIVGGIMLINSSLKSANELITLPIFMWQAYICVPVSGFFISMFLLENLQDLIFKREGE